MKRKRIAKLLAVMILLIALFTPVNFTIAQDGDDSDVTIIYSNDLPTNQDIVITVETNDNLSGVKEVILPDGTRITEKIATYTVTENGSYEFRVLDNAENETRGTVNIDNIDKENPILELVADKTEPTNQDVIINVKAIDEQSGIKEIILPDGTKITEEVTNYTVTENGNFEFKAIDNAGNETSEIIEIANIDKIPPVITIEPYETNWTNQDITVYAKADKGELNQESYMFTENGEFTFVVIDKAGNRTEETVKITNIDKVKPTMKITVGE